MDKAVLVELSTALGGLVQSLYTEREMAKLVRFLPSRPHTHTLNNGYSELRLYVHTCITTPSCIFLSIYVYIAEFIVHLHTYCWYTCMHALIHVVNTCTPGRNFEESAGAKGGGDESGQGKGRNPNPRVSKERVGSPAQDTSLFHLL